MEIALVDVDSHNFPNLVLMKLSAWHKNRGDRVTLMKAEEALKEENLIFQYDKIYGACVFSGQEAKLKELEKRGVHLGGTGTKYREILPYEIEHIMPDYSLYGISDTAYGFLTRGCPRKCPFFVWECQKFCVSPITNRATTASTIAITQKNLHSLFV